MTSKPPSPADEIVIRAVRIDSGIIDSSKGLVLDTDHVYGPKGYDAVYQIVAIEPALAQPAIPDDNDLRTRLSELVEKWRDRGKSSITNYQWLDRADELAEVLADGGDGTTVTPIDILLYCPYCGEQHIDQPEPDRGWTNPPHKTHECRFCRVQWRPSQRPTNGVAAIPRIISFNARPTYFKTGKDFDDAVSEQVRHSTSRVEGELRTAKELLADQDGLVARLRKALEIARQWLLTDAAGDDGRARRAANVLIAIDAALQPEEKVDDAKASRGK